MIGISAGGNDPVQVFKRWKAGPRQFRERSRSHLHPLNTFHYPIGLCCWAEIIFSHARLTFTGESHKKLNRARRSEETISGQKGRSREVVVLGYWAHKERPPGCTRSSVGKSVTQLLTSHSEERSCQYVVKMCERACSLGVD